MKVSVIIPAYNEAEFIGRTIEAVLAQTHPDVEIIVADNASTDSTGQIASSFPGVKVVREMRAGSQFARECARQSATGDVIACLDADSIPPPDWIVRGIDYFKSEKVVAVDGSLEYYDGPKLICFTANLIQKTHYVFINWLFQTLGLGAVMIGANCFIRSSALQKINGFNTNILFYGDDTDTAKRLMKVGKVLYRPSLSIRSSARRFDKRGVLKTAYLYSINFLWVVFFNRPFSQRKTKNYSENKYEGDFRITDKS